MTGVASTWMIAVAYSAQMNSGMSNQPMPGARSLCTVTMKFSPVRIELNPRMNAPVIMKTTRQWSASVVVEYGV